VPCNDANFRIGTLAIHSPPQRSFDPASGRIKSARCGSQQRLPTATASLGSLSTPVVGITSSMLMFGERPTTEDMIGFALIFAVAACALTQPARRAVAQAP
jgi:drug/metabolite transporter (DMT)-like permease